MIDIGVYFSGYNLGMFGYSAVASFLNNYPELRHNVFYFDDYSNDLTRDYMIELGVNILEWDEDYMQEYQDTCKEQNILNEGTRLMLRCDYIFKQLLKHCSNRYQLILDVDTVTLMRGFIEDFTESSLVIETAECYMDIPTDTGKLGTYENILTSVVLSSLGSRVGRDNMLTKIAPYYLLLDRSKFVETQELIDNLKNTEYIQLYKSGYLDVGADVLLKCILSGYDYNLRLELPIHHWGWISSSARMGSSEHFRTFVRSSSNISEEVRHALLSVDTPTASLKKAYRKIIQSL